LCDNLEERFNIPFEELDNLQYQIENKTQYDLSTVIPETRVDVDYGGINICELQDNGTDNYEDELFFYHGNHLSSSQMITDMYSNVVQQVYYAPFGEVITEYNAYWHQGKIPDYMFNAKELDEENGMYYYEARYYNPPMFISRDPLFEKYPFMSPYAYCSNNPVIRIDPDGREDYEWDLKTKKITVVDGTQGTPDRLIIKKENGETVTGNSYERGTIKLQANKNNEQYLKITGDKNGKEMFEFAANNTGIEWGHLQTGKGGTKGDNYLFTSYNEGKINFNFHGAIKDYIRTYNHNHPNGTTTPSNADLNMYDKMQIHNWDYGKKEPDANIYINKGQGSYHSFYNRTIQGIFDGAKKEFLDQLFPKPKKP
jgi:RHS repeat-associated protein